MTVDDFIICTNIAIRGSWFSSTQDTKAIVQSLDTTTRRDAAGYKIGEIYVAENHIVSSHQHLNSLDAEVEVTGSSWRIYGEGFNLLVDIAQARKDLNEDDIFELSRYFKTIRDKSFAVTSKTFSVGGNTVDNITENLLIAKCNNLYASNMGPSKYPSALCLNYLCYYTLVGSEEQLLQQAMLVNLLHNSQTYSSITKEWRQG